MLTCGKDRTFRLWNPYKGLLVKTNSGLGHEVHGKRAAMKGRARSRVWRSASAAARLASAFTTFASHQGRSHPPLEPISEHDSPSRVNVHTDARTRSVDWTSVECLFSMTPLPRLWTLARRRRRAPFPRDQWILPATSSTRIVNPRVLSQMAL